MRNEAKSIEIASKVADGYGIDFEPLAEVALDMAEWKDQQFKEILKEECNTSYESGLSEGERKAEVRFKEYLEKMQKEFTDDEAGYYVINRIINELFNAD